MTRDNVVPFVSAAHGALARRGAPDKLRRLARRFDLECPNCAAVLSFEDASVFSAGPEIFCEACDGRLALPMEKAAAD
jgi:hypothetical protein